MADLTAALSAVVKEELGPGIHRAQLEIDPVWQDVFKSRMGVTREGLGRDWKFLKTFVTGMGGAYEFVSHDTLEGADLDFDHTNVKIFGEPNTWPGRSTSTAPAFYQKTVYLKEARGNFFTPLKWMQIDTFDSSIGSAVAELIKGTAKKVALQHALSFYGPTNTSYDGGVSTPNYKAVVLTDISECVTASNGAGTNDIWTVTFTGDSSEITGRINQIFVGQMFNVYDTSNNKEAGTWVVTVVDPMGTPGTDRGKFIMQDTSVTGLSTATAADGAYLVPINSNGNQPSGLNSWTKNSGSVYGISLTTRPWFKSLIQSASGGSGTAVLTETDLNKWYGTFHERYMGMCSLDSIVTSAGVIHSFLENADNNARFERNGKRLNLTTGWSGVSYGYEGKDFQWHMSNFVEPQTLFMLKTGEGNIKEYLPPRTPGVGSRSDFENEIQFVAQLGGSKSIYLHERVVNAAASGNTSAPIGDQLEAPFFRFCELAPDQVQGVKITDLTESYA